jgi:hypothetical protein
MRLPPLCHVTGVLKITHSGLPWPSILKANWSLGSLGWPTSSHVLTESLQRSRPLWCYLSPLQPKANSSLVWDHISHEPSSWYSLLWCYGIFPMESPWRWSWITPCLTHWRCFLLDSNCSIPLLMTVDEEQLSNWKIPRNTRGFSFMQMVSWGEPALIWDKQCYQPWTTTGRTYPLLSKHQLEMSGSPGQAEVANVWLNSSYGGVEYCLIGGPGRLFWFGILC